RLNVFRRTGKACPRCGTTVTRMVVAQRSSHICANCQPLQEEEARPNRKCRVLPGHQGR
ncbi:DNA-formamidopyrimidine glycosylase, partial [Citrobacter sp. AAK_AS5]